MNIKQVLGTTTLVILLCLDKSNIKELAVFINAISVINATQKNLFMD